MLTEQAWNNDGEAFCRREWGEFTAVDGGKVELLPELWIVKIDEQDYWIDPEPGSREALEQQHGQVWDTDQLREDFQVLGFMAPLVVVARRSDGVKGSLYFQHSPRLYYGFKED